MPRRRIYASDAERQAAYRARQRKAQLGTEAERQATLDAAWMLREAIHYAAQRGDTQAIRLNRLPTSHILKELADDFSHR